MFFAQVQWGVVFGSFQAINKHACWLINARPDRWQKWLLIRLDCHSESLFALFLSNHHFNPHHKAYDNWWRRIYLLDSTTRIGLLQGWALGGIHHWDLSPNLAHRREFPAAKISSPSGADRGCPASVGSARPWPSGSYFRDAVAGSGK